MSADLTAQFKRAQPQLQAATDATLTPFAPTVTSVIDGPHVKGSAHFDGRAIDIGAFEGTPVGWNQPTFQAIISAIMSRRWTRIGTLPEIVKVLKNFALRYGVDMFVDVGTGPHAHFQTGP